MFCGYVFLRNVLAKVLTRHLPEHKLKPLGGVWLHVLENVVVKVLIWHLPEPALGRSLGWAEAVPGGPGVLAWLWRSAGVPVGSLGGSWASLGGPGDP